MFTYDNAFSGFSVNDLQKAKQFYSTLLNFDVDENKMGILELKTKGNNPIFVYPKPNHAPATFTILNFTVDNIEKTVDELTGKGITFEQYSGKITTDERGICRGGHGPAIAWFKDPAGNILSIIEK